MKAPRLAQIDAIRGLAAVLVLVYHVHLVTGVDLVPGPIAAGGSSGVGIFFALSGYLLFRPFLNGAVNLRAYAVRRFLRVWPAYLLAIIGCALLLGVSAPAEAPLVFASAGAELRRGTPIQDRRRLVDADHRGRLLRHGAAPRLAHPAATGPPADPDVALDRDCIAPRTLRHHRAGASVATAARPG